MSWKTRTTLAVTGAVLLATGGAVLRFPDGELGRWAAVGGVTDRATFVQILRLPREGDGPMRRQPAKVVHRVTEREAIAAEDLPRRDRLHPALDSGAKGRIWPYVWGFIGGVPICVEPPSSAHVPAIADRNVDEGSPVTFAAAAADTDLPAQTLSYALQNAPAGAAISAAGRR